MNLSEKLITLVQRLAQEFNKKVNKDDVSTTEKQGIVELATKEEVIAGTDDTRAITPKSLVEALDELPIKGSVTPLSEFTIEDPNLVLFVLDAESNVMPYINKDGILILEDVA